MKRQRGRGRKPGGGGGGGGNPGNRPLESNGPDVKIRGTAAQIYEKYAQYARDAQSSGDRVKYENYLQHAEHYYRIMAATMPRDQRPQQSGDLQNSSHNQPEENEAEETASDPMKVVDEAGEEEAAEASFEAEETEGEEAAEAAEAGGEERGERNGRRRRRSRRNSEGGGQAREGQQGETREGRGDTEARSALDSLARKQGALAGG